MSRIVPAILAMTGRETMLGISRWTEKAAAKPQARKTIQKQKKKGKPSRPKGSKNQDKTQVTLTPELTRIQQMVQKLLLLNGRMLALRFLVMDGKFGHNNAL